MRPSVQPAARTWPQSFLSFALPQAGDYADVLMLPMMLQGATARLRLQPGEFVGYAVMHCHSLQVSRWPLRMQPGCNVCKHAFFTAVLSAPTPAPSSAA